jgi:hypothetical protein
MTPHETLLAGQREAVMELAMGRPGADVTTPLISQEAGVRMLATLGDVPGRRTTSRRFAMPEPSGPLHAPDVKNSEARVFLSAAGCGRRNSNPQALSSTGTLSPVCGPFQHAHT